jgi:glycosyltransferase involved in cell wall biosynthesis
MTGVLQSAPALAPRTAARPIIVATIARPAGWTGVHAHFTELLRSLESSGHRGQLVTPFSNQEAFANAVFAPRRLLSRVHPVANVWWYEEGHFRMLKRALIKALRDAGDVTVYAQCPISARAATEARAGRYERVVMAVHFNASQADEWVTQAGLDPDSRMYASIRRRERRILPALDGIVYVSQYMHRRLEETIPGLDRVPSVVIPNFVTALNATSPAGRGTDLISVGTLEPRKNQTYLLRVLAEAAKLGRRYTLSLVGDGPDRAMLESRAHELGIRHQLRFFGFQPDARQLLPGHRAYVHAARFENLPVALIEALAASLPIFAANVGGISEVFDNAVEGLYWDLDDPESGARQLIGVLESPAKQLAMAKAARARFETTFEATMVAGRLRDFLLAV